MSVQTALLPLFVEVLLTFGLLVWLGILRRKDLWAGRVQLRDIALREPKWPPRTLQAAFSFSNQFELPVLFYVLTILVIITRHTDWLFLILAWIFVICRLAHAWVHLTSNNVRYRGAIYSVAAIALFVAWVSFFIRLMLGTP
jgi:hypothetical protein